MKALNFVLAAVFLSFIGLNIALGIPPTNQVYPDAEPAAVGGVLGSNLDANGNLIFDSTGILQMGTAAVTSHALGTGDVIFGDETEFNGTAFFDNAIMASGNLTVSSPGIFNLSDDTRFTFGPGANDGGFEHDTNQTNDAVLFSAPSTSNSVLFIEDADRGVDFGHAVATDPTFFIQSADATTTSDFMAFRHDQTNAVINVGGGGLIIEFAGVSDWTIDTGGIYPTAGQGGAILDVNSSSTVPGVIPEFADPNTGLGRGATDSLSGIAGGVEGWRITEVGAAITELIMQIPQGSIAATCATGELFYDTDVTHELCFCRTTNTWSCISVTTTTGPTD